MHQAMRSSHLNRLGKHTIRLPEEGICDWLQLIFYQDEGGLRATDEANEGLDMMYYMGVIDISTPYSLVKRAEHPRISRIYLHMPLTVVYYATVCDTERSQWFMVINYTNRTSQSLRILLSLDRFCPGSWGYYSIHGYQQEKGLCTSF